MYVVCIGLYLLVLGGVDDHRKQPRFIACIACIGMYLNVFSMYLYVFLKGIQALYKQIQTYRPILDYLLVILTDMYWLVFVCFRLYWSVLCQYWFNACFLHTNTCKYMAIHINMYWCKILGWNYAFNTLMIVLACIYCITDRYQRQAAQYTCERHYPHPRLRLWHTNPQDPRQPSAMLAWELQCLSMNQYMSVQTQYNINTIHVKYVHAAEGHCKGL